MSHYVTQGTCSQAIDFTVKEGIVHDVSFTKGCNGNTKGLAALVEGMPATAVIEALDGITCGNKPTSCPDQLAQALKGALNEKEACRD